MPRAPLCGTSAIGKGKLGRNRFDRSVLVTVLRTGKRRSRKFFDGRGWKWGSKMISVTDRSSESKRLPTKRSPPVAANALCIAVHPTVPAQDLKELIAYAKANPGKLSYGHSGVGSIQHLTGELRLGSFFTSPAFGTAFLWGATPLRCAVRQPSKIAAISAI
jgi:hypothetical protein